jgi:dCTP deaminase
MSVLAHTEIKRRLTARSLVISPILVADQIGDVSVDVRMGNVALVVRGGGISHLDPRAYLATEQTAGQKGEQGRRQKFERFDLEFGDALILHPNSLALVPTLEWFSLPKDLMGIVTARSSWAREGLSIATATFIDPTYIGVITLELANLGHVPIALYPGMRVAQIAFEQVRGAGRSKAERQFVMSFEPKPGEISKGDGPFIPSPESARHIDSANTGGTTKAAKRIPQKAPRTSAVQRKPHKTRAVGRK